MKYTIIAHPGAKVTKIESWLYQGEEVIHIYTSARAVDWSANEAILILLAEYLWIKNYELELVSGQRSKRKIIRRLEGHKLS